VPNTPLAGRYVDSIIPPGRKQESSAILERHLNMTGKRSSKEAKLHTVFGQTRKSSKYCELDSMLACPRLISRPSLGQYRDRGSLR
jgi:hypothetical protein